MQKYSIFICCLISLQINAQLLNDAYILVNNKIYNRDGVWLHSAMNDILPEDNTQDYSIDLSGNLLKFEYNLSYEKTDKKLKLNTLFTELDINDNLSIKIGKFIENWQIGNSFNPLAVTDPYYNQSILDGLPQNQIGINAFSINYIFDTGNNINFYKNYDNHDYDPVKGYGYHASAIRFNYVLTAASDLTLIAHKKKNKKTGFGSGIRTIVNDNLQTYGSFFIRQGTTKATHLGVLNNNKNLIAISNPIGEHRKDDDKYYPRAMLGLQFTTDNNLDVIAEISYDKRGMDNAEWDTYKALVNNHKMLNAPADANLVWDLSLVNDKTGLRQYYSFIRLEKTFDNYKFGFSSNIGQDLSALNRVKFHYDIGDNLEFITIFSHTTGKKDSEYESYFPYKNKFSISLLYNFF